MAGKANTQVLDADESKALAAYRKLTATERASFMEAQKHRQQTGRELSKQKGQFDGVEKSAGGLGKTLLGFAAGILTIGTLTTALRLLDERMVAVAANTNEVAKSIVNLALVDPSGQAEQLAATLGARFGVGPKTSIEVAQPFISRRGLEEGLAGAEETFKLTQLQATPQEAQEILRFFRNKGVSFEDAGKMIAAGAQAAEVGVPEFAKAGPAIKQFEDPISFIAATFAQSGAETPERMRTAVEQVGRVLSIPSTFVDNLTEFAKKEGLDFEQLTENEKLSLLSRNLPAGGVSAELGKLGLEGKAIGAFKPALTNLPESLALGRRIETILASPEDFVSQRIREAAKDPLVAEFFKGQQAKAGFQLEQVFSPEALKAQQDVRLRVGVGTELQRRGMGAFVDADTGMPNAMTSMLLRAGQSLLTGQFGPTDIFGVGNAALIKEGPSAGADFQTLNATLDKMLKRTEEGNDDRKKMLDETKGAGAMRPAFNSGS